MSVGLAFHGVPVTTSYVCARDQILRMPDGGLVMHPFMWISLTRSPLDALDQILRVMVARAGRALDRAAAELGSEVDRG